MLKVCDDRQMKALTGLSQAQFDELLPTFSAVYQETRQEAYEIGLIAGNRRRQPGGGAKGKLPTPTDKLFFTLYYHKTYPTFDVLGTHFEMSRSKAHENLHKLTPLLHQTLVRLEMMPHREFNSPTDLKAALAGIDQIIVDATERAYRRPQDEATQEEYYSGKKQGHTVKNTVISTLSRFIIFLGRTFRGHHHDYAMLKQEFPPDQDWFRDLAVWLDLGYQGVQSDYVGETIAIPTKKPPKSQKNPAPQLTEDQKAANQALSRVRVFVEHAIGGLKRYNIVVHRFRNHKTNFEDAVVGICAGLWNFTLTY